MVIKFLNRIPKCISKDFPVLFKNHPSNSLYNKNSSHEDRCREIRNAKNVFMCFYDDDEVVGLVDMSFRDYVLYEGVPYYMLYIDRFEVRKDKYRRGYGKQMFDYILTHYDIYNIELNHIVDDETSYRFWKSMGLKRYYANNTYMYLNFYVKKLI